MDCALEGEQGSQTHLDTRVSLVGNSGGVIVVAWLLNQWGFVRALNQSLRSVFRQGDS